MRVPPLVLRPHHPSLHTSTPPHARLTPHPPPPTRPHPPCPPCSKHPELLKEITLFVQTGGASMMPGAAGGEFDDDGGDEDDDGEDAPDDEEDYLDEADGEDDGDGGMHDADEKGGVDFMEYASGVLAAGVRGARALGPRGEHDGEGGGDEEEDGSGGSDGGHPRAGGRQPPTYGGDDQPPIAWAHVCVGPGAPAAERSGRGGAG